MELKEAIEEVKRQWGLCLEYDFDADDVEHGVVDATAIATILNAVMRGELKA